MRMQSKTTANLIIFRCMTTENGDQYLAKKPNFRDCTGFFLIFSICPRASHAKKNNNNNYVYKMPVPPGASRYLLVKFYVFLAFVTFFMVITWRMTRSNTKTFYLTALWALILIVVYRRVKRAQKKKYMVLPVHLRYPGSFSL